MESPKVIFSPHVCDSDSVQHKGWKSLNCVKNNLDLWEDCDLMSSSPSIVCEHMPIFNGSLSTNIIEEIHLNYSCS